jgi:flagellar protein FliS
MLYDRLALDITRASERLDGASAAGVIERDAAAALDHAVQIVTELLASLDVNAGGPAGNLAALYGWLLRELLAVRTGDPQRLPAVAEIVATLRAAWASAAEQLSAGAVSTPSGGAVAWVS